MDNRQWMMLAAVVVVIIIAVMYFAWYKCHLGKYSRAACADTVAPAYTMAQAPQMRYTESNEGDKFKFAGHQILRNKGAISSTVQRLNTAREGPSQPSAHQSRQDSASDGFNT